MVTELGEGRKGINLNHSWLGKWDLTVLDLPVLHASPLTALLAQDSPPVRVNGLPVILR